MNNTKENIPTLNGYYQKDFDEKQKLIKKLLEVNDVEWNDLDLLMDGTLHKFCSKEKRNNGNHFWYSW